MAKVRVNVVDPITKKNVIGIYNDEKDTITLAGGIVHPADEVVINAIYN